MKKETSRSGPAARAEKKKIKRHALTIEGGEREGERQPSEKVSGGKYCQNSKALKSGKKDPSGST